MTNFTVCIACHGPIDEERRELLETAERLDIELDGMGRCSGCCFDADDAASITKAA